MNEKLRALLLWFISWTLSEHSGLIGTLGSLGHLLVNWKVCVTAALLGYTLPSRRVQVSSLQPEWHLASATKRTNREGAGMQWARVSCVCIPEGGSSDDVSFNAGLTRAVMWRSHFTGWCSWFCLSGLNGGKAGISLVNKAACRCVRILAQLRLLLTGSAGVPPAAVCGEEPGVSGGAGLLLPARWLRHGKHSPSTARSRFNRSGYNRSASDSSPGNGLTTFWWEKRECLKFMNIIQ